METMDPETNNMQERIRKIMDSSKMSQQDFANELGISPASLSSIFNGRTRPTNNHTIAIHKAFPKIRMNWLLFGEGEMYENSSEHSDVEIGSPSIQSPQLFPENSAAGLYQNCSGRLPENPTAHPSYIQMQKETGYLLDSENSKKNIDIIKRQIKEIRVFFDDGTYESFVPQK